MIERRSRLGLMNEALAVLFVGAEIARQELQSH